MRLLHTKELRLVADSDAEYKADPRYAIVSHRWLADEVDFHNLHRLECSDESSLAVKKVKGACRQASKDGFTWIWIDSACICKTDAVELGRSINSMFKWYRKAETCYTYLSDVILADTPQPDSSTFRRRQDFAGRSNVESEASEWFTRGWTLQELLASNDMQFFDRDWNLMGSKQQLAHTIAEITGINSGFLTGKLDFRAACIAVKMSWMAHRQTTEEVDRAYSMLGIFDVSMDIMYGEGKKAFTRLQKLLLSTYVDESLFAWTTPTTGLPSPRSRSIRFDEDEWGVLAPSSECFAGMGNIRVRAHSPSWMRPSHPTMTAEGLHFSSTAGRTAASYHLMKSGLGKFVWNLVFFPVWGFYTSLLVDPACSHYLLSVNCYWRTAQGLKPVFIHVRSKDGQYRRVECSRLETKILPMGGGRWWYNSRLGGGFTILQPEPDD